MQQIKVIQEPTETKPFVVIQKPSGLFSAPIRENETNNALFQAAKFFPEILKVDGFFKKFEHGLLHRLDTETEGLLLIATTQEFYNFLLKEQKEGNFFKYYEAKCLHILKNAELLEGFPPCPIEFTEANNFVDPKILKSFFRNYGKSSKTVRPVTQESGKSALKKAGKKLEYSTEIKIQEIENNIFKANCKISVGYRHQVRCHLAWCGFPIIGDSLYNSEYNKNSNEKLLFRATEIEFKNPITNKIEFYSIK